MVTLDSEMAINDEENGYRIKNQTGYTHDWCGIDIRKGCWSFILTKLQHALALEVMLFVLTVCQNYQFW